jgi:hypothetical protein
MRLAHRPLLVELLAHHLDDDRRHGDVHHPHRLPNAHLDANRYHRFVGRQQMQQLWLGVHAFDGEIYVRDPFPGLPQILQNNAEQTVQQTLLDFRNVALDGRRALPGAAQQHLEDGKHQAGVQFQHTVAIVRAQSERNDTGRRGQPVQKFRVR